MSAAVGCAFDQGHTLHAAGRQPPHPTQEPMAPFHHLIALGAPVEVVRGRPDEQVEQSQRVGAHGGEVVLGCDQVAPRLGHLGAVQGDHALREQPGKRLPYPRRRQAHVGQGPGVEAGVQQVQDGVLDAADVLVDRHPVGRRRLVDGRLDVPGVAEALEVPGRVDEGVHGVGLALGRAAAPGAGGVQEALVVSQWRLAGRTELDVVGQQDRQLILGHRDDAVVRAVHHRDGAAPVPLAREQPVPQAVVDLALADALALPASRWPGPWPRPLSTMPFSQSLLMPRPVAGVGLALPALRWLRPCG